MTMTPVPTLSITARQEQATFRALLDCMARPGKIAALVERRPEDGPWAAALAVLASLLDHETSVALLAADQTPREQLLRRTGSRVAEPEAADFILADAGGALAAVQRAGHGTLEDPHVSGTVVLRCRSLGDGPLTLTLAGPGVDGTATLRLDGIDRVLFDTLAERNALFPLGVDLILTDEAGRVACLPRSTRLTLG